MLEVVREIWLFLLSYRKIWLIPLLGFMLLIGGLLIVAEGSAIAPFIYTIF
jgi:hypothetical protein